MKVYTVILIAWFRNPCTQHYSFVSASHWAELNLIRTKKASGLSKFVKPLLFWIRLLICTLDTFLGLACFITVPKVYILYSMPRKSIHKALYFSKHKTLHEDILHSYKIWQDWDYPTFVLAYLPLLVATSAGLDPQHVLCLKKYGVNEKKNELRNHSNRTRECEYSRPPDCGKEVFLIKKRSHLRHEKIRIISNIGARVFGEINNGKTGKWRWKLQGYWCKLNSYSVQNTSLKVMT